MLVTSTQTQDHASVQSSPTPISVHNKYPAIVKFISDNDTDLFAMSETWIRPDTMSANLFEITPPGYNLYQQPQEVHRGGGLECFIKDGLDPSIVIIMYLYSAQYIHILKDSKRYFNQLFLERPAPPLKISSSRHLYIKNLLIF